MFVCEQTVCKKRRNWQNVSFFVSKKCFTLSILRTKFRIRTKFVSLWRFFGSRGYGRSHGEIWGIVLPNLVIKNPKGRHVTKKRKTTFCSFPFFITYLLFGFLITELGKLFPKLRHDFFCNPDCRKTAIMKQILHGYFACKV